MSYPNITIKHDIWNKGKLIGQKLPLKQEQTWSIRFRLEMDKKILSPNYFKNNQILPC